MRSLSRHLRTTLAICTTLWSLSHHLTM
ncbi:MAG: hypothetical protein E7143_01385 [Rikenellaceae bacterium]|nr:hypothetical protein [Rikenellaceae bacterium]